MGMASSAYYLVKKASFMGAENPGFDRFIVPKRTGDPYNKMIDSLKEGIEFRLEKLRKGELEIHYPPVFEASSFPENINIGMKEEANPYVEYVALLISRTS
jgi:hypothetical protein